MNQTAKPYNTRGMVEVMRTRANFGDIFLGRYIAGNMTGWLGSRRAVLLMRVLALRFSSGCTLPMSSNLREVARTLVNSRELFKDKNQWKQRPSPTKHEEWSKSRELARTLTPFFIGNLSSNTTGRRGSLRDAWSMRVHASGFSRSLTLPVPLNSGEVARTLLNSRELFEGENQWTQRQSPTKHEEWSKSHELARTITPFFVAGVSPTQRSQLILSGICPKRDAAMFWCRVLKFQNWPIRQLYNGQGTQWPFLKFERPTPA